MSRCIVGSEERWGLEGGEEQRCIIGHEERGVEN